MDADTLINQGRKYTTKNLHSLPSDISGYKASSKESETSVAFFGELSPFSNFNITLSPCTVITITDPNNSYKPRKLSSSRILAQETKF